METIALNNGVKSIIESDRHTEHDPCSTVIQQEELPALLVKAQPFYFALLHNIVKAALKGNPRRVADEKKIEYFGIMDSGCCDTVDVLYCQRGNTSAGVA